MKDNTIRKEEVHAIIESHLDFMMYNAECNEREWCINEYYHMGYKKALNDAIDIVEFAFNLKEESEATDEKITQSKFDEMVKSHNLWLNGDDRGERLVLKNKNLQGLDLSYKNLSKADFRGSDLSNTMINYSNMSGVDLTKASLSNATISHTNMDHSILSYADLSYAELEYVTLEETWVTCIGLKGLAMRKTDLTPTKQ